MALGVVGIKCGMTHVFDQMGKFIPVSVVLVVQNRITYIKNEKEGYYALQVAFGEKKRANKSLTSIYLKSGLEKPAKGLCEFRVDKALTETYQVGDSLDLDLFEAGQSVDVMGVTKGKGFAGTVKRHNFRMQDATHGNSLSHRVMGSTGQCQYPGRVFKGKKMPGQMGHKRCTIKGLKVVDIDKENQLILINGAIPGAPGGYVRVFTCHKKEEVS